MVTREEGDTRSPGSIIWRMQNGIIGLYAEGPCIGTECDCFSARAPQTSKKVAPTYSSTWTQMLILFVLQGAVAFFSSSFSEVLLPGF